MKGRLISASLFPRLAAALRAVQPVVGEVLLAALIAAAALMAYRAVGGQIELWKRMHLWYEAKVLWMQQHVPAAGTAPQLSSAETIAAASRERNPFLAFTGEAGFRFHPLIDVVGAQFRGNYNFFEERDYFGFRNNFDAYADPGNYTYVVMTGNSELVGISHNVTISQNLQDILNARSRKKYRVLNLGINSATTANEINYFVNLAFNLHPEFVISHSFTTDMIYGYDVPPEFQAMGLFYQGIQTTWARLIHAGNFDPMVFEKLSPSFSESHLLEGYLRNLRRYRVLVEASGAHFILGLQKFDESHAKGTPSEEAWVRVKRIYGDFKRLIDDHKVDVEVIDFNAFPDIQLSSNLDPIHTNDASARRIAEIYAAHILALERSESPRDVP